MNTQVFLVLEIGYFMVYSADWYLQLYNTFLYNNVSLYSLVSQLDKCLMIVNCWTLPCSPFEAIRRRSSIPWSCMNTYIDLHSSHTVKAITKWNEVHKMEDSIYLVFPHLPRLCKYVFQYKYSILLNIANFGLMCWYFRGWEYYNITYSMIMTHMLLTYLLGESIPYVYSTDTISAYFISGSYRKSWLFSSTLAFFRLQENFENSGKWEFKLLGKLVFSFFWQHYRIEFHKSKKEL